MPRVHRHPQASKVGRFAALATAVALPLGLLSAGAASASPTPAPTLLNSTSATGVASTLNVRAQTGEWALAQASIDTSRDRLYIPIAYDPAKVVQVDLTTGIATATPLGGSFAPADSAVSPLDGTVYVSHNSGHLPAISVLDPSQSYTDAALPPLITSGLAGNPYLLDVGDDGRVYVAHLGQETISVIGASTGPDRMNVVQTLPGISSRDGYMAIDNVRDRLYVVSPVSSTLTVIDTKAVPAAVLGVIPLDVSPVGVGVNAETGQVLVTSIEPGSVSWLTIAADHSSAIVTRTEPLAPLPAGASSTSQPSSINVRADGTTLVVTHVYPSSQFLSQVTVIPPVVSATAPSSVAVVGWGANGGVLDPRGGTLYVPNGSQGTVSEISEVTLSTYATSTTVGSDGVLRAQLTRADGRQLPGTVSFTDSAAQSLGDATVDAAGTAEVAVSKPPVGSFGFTATVTTPTAIPLSAAGELTVAKAASTTTLTMPTAIEGSSASATIEVTGLSGSVATGGFTVTTATGDVLATGALTDGRATASFAAPPAGTTSVIAHYLGDSTLVPSDSTAVDLVVTGRTPTGTAASTQGTVGDKSSVSVTGFAPGEDVTVSLHSDPVILGTITADSVGSGTLAFVVPAVDPGLHHLVAVGESSGREVTVPFTVIAAPTAEIPTPTETATPAPSANGTAVPALASTGSDSMAAIWLVALLLLLGAGASGVAASRARRL